MNQNSVDTIVQSIKVSKKYQSVFLPTIERIVQECAQRYPEKLVETQARNKLHQIWGAYWSTRPDFNKLFTKFQQDIQSGLSPKEALTPILRLQSSTAERLPILAEFYQKIFAITGIPNTISDLACGLNPLTYFWMNLPETTQYLAADIDEEEVDFLNSLFKLLNKAKQITVTPNDIFNSPRSSSEVTLLLKTLPVLEQQQKGTTQTLLTEFFSTWLVASFPIKSIGGQEKGMEDFYAQNFERLLTEQKLKSQKLLFKSELVYIINK